MEQNVDSKNGFKKIFEKEFVNVCLDGDYKSFLYKILDLRNSKSNWREIKKVNNTPQHQRQDMYASNKNKKSEKRARIVFLVLKLPQD